MAEDKPTLRKLVEAARRVLRVQEAAKEEAKEVKE